MKKPKTQSAAKHAHRRPSNIQLTRLLKIHDILNEAFHSRRRANCSSLAAELEVSSKTINRDMDYLRDELKLDVEYDYAERSFSYTKEHPHFPLGHDLSFDERVALVVARQSLDVFAGVGLGEKLRTAFDKITGGMLGDCGALLHGPLSGYISVRTPGAGRIEDGRVFRAVFRALLGQFELRIDYQAKGHAAFTPHRLHPYHLACVANRWVLVALNTDKNVVHTYVLARFRNPSVTTTGFDRPAGFDPNKYLGTSLDVWAGTGAKIVRLRISPAGAHHVLERNWHATQFNTPQPGGFVEVMFNLSDLNDITRLVLSFGSDCEVLEPLELRSLIAEEGRRMAKQNGS